MRSTAWKGVWASFCLATAFLGSSFVGVGAAVENRDVSVTTLGRGNPVLRAVSARWEGPDLVVRGKIRRRFSSLVKGHVDVALCTEQGTMVRLATAPPFPRGRTGRGRRGRSFTVRLTRVEAPLGEVRVAWHGPLSLHDPESACAPAVDGAPQGGS